MTLRLKSQNLKASLNDLYEIAKEKDITVTDTDCPECKAISLLSPSGKCYIGMDYNAIKTEQEERLCLAHDIGHCETGAFYNPYSSQNVISQQEFRANKKALDYLVPRKELESVMADGQMEIWELCEYFDVNIKFIQLAFWVYFDKEI